MLSVIIHVPMFLILELKESNKMVEDFLTGIKKQFEYYKSLGEKSFDQLNEDELFVKLEKDSNSIAVLVNHLSGNMKSRWTDFLTTDGEKEWRNRDSEFEDIIRSEDELIKRWNEGWNCLFNALDSLNESNINNVVLIRNQEHSIVLALLRQLGHYAFHIGQIVLIAKTIKGEQWKSLTIPKGKSEEFNKGLMNR